jgi:hypothetical protein
MPRDVIDQPALEGEAWLRLAPGDGPETRIACGLRDRTDRQAEQRRE